jgi:hypothetical protein
MKEISRRLRKLEVSHAAQRNAHGLNPADVLRQRVCRHQAAETGRPYEELLRESEMESQAFWASYDGDRSIVGILRSRFDRKVKPTLGSGCASAIEPMRRSDD